MNYFKLAELASALHLTGQPTTNMQITKPTKTHPTVKKKTLLTIWTQKRNICVLVFTDEFLPQICNLQQLPTTTPSPLPLSISFWGRKQGRDENEDLQEWLGWLPWLAIRPFSRLQLVHLQNEKHRN